MEKKHEKIGDYENSHMLIAIRSDVILLTRKVKQLSREVDEVVNALESLGPIVVEYYNLKERPSKNIIDVKCNRGMIQ